MTDSSLEELYSVPGFMLRRAHQISVSIFDNKMSEIGVTPTQLSILYTINLYPNIDQISLCNRLGIDRSTATVVIRLLEKNGLVTRQTSKEDKRRKTLTLTPEGVKKIEEALKVASSIREGILRPFTPEEAQIFTSLLKKLVNSLNDLSRTPIK